MTLGALIKFLEGLDQNRIVPIGFHRPHSYRGYYDQLAFEPKFFVAVHEMLSAARAAVNQTYHGYKGGEYLMTEDVRVWVAEYGDGGTEMELVLPIFFESKTSSGKEVDSAILKMAGDSPTLRDCYAMNAMNGILACSKDYAGAGTTEKRVRYAFEIADAMLAAREVKQS